MAAIEELEMNRLTPAAELPIRKVVALARAGLDAAGHTDIAIDETWLREEMDDIPFVLDVPISAEITLPIYPLDAPGGDLDRTAEGFAQHLIEALPNLKRASRKLKSYHASVRREAVKEITAARASGLDLVIEAVRLRPICARYLTSSDWEAAAYEVVATVDVRCLSFFLRPDIHSVRVEDPVLIRDAMADLLHEQRRYQSELAALRKMGADLRIEQVTVDLLQHFGHDPVEVLRRVWRGQSANLTVTHKGEELNLAIISSHGRASASIVIEGSLWNGEFLWLPGPFPEDRRGQVPGLAMTELVDVEAFRSVTVLEVAPQPGTERAMLIPESPTLLFDASTGRIWPE